MMRRRRQQPRDVPNANEAGREGGARARWIVSLWRLAGGTPGAGQGRTRALKGSPDYCPRRGERPQNGQRGRRTKQSPRGGGRYGAGRHAYGNALRWREKGERTKEAPHAGTAGQDFLLHMYLTVPLRSAAFDHPPTDQSFSSAISAAAREKNNPRRRRGPQPAEGAAPGSRTGQKPKNARRSRSRLSRA